MNCTLIVEAVGNFVSNNATNAAIIHHSNLGLDIVI